MKASVQQTGRAQMPGDTPHQAEVFFENTKARSVSASVEAGSDGPDKRIDRRVQQAILTIDCVRFTKQLHMQVSELSRAVVAVRRR